MTNPKIRQAWQALFQHAEHQKPCHLRALFEADERRFEDFSLQQPGIVVDFSKQRISRETLDRLHDLAEACDITQWQEKMLAGDPINHTENRAALHMALRVPANAGINIPRQGTSVIPEVHQNLAKLQAFCSAVHEKSWRGYSNEYITDVVNLGIGGSDLGPRMVVQALAAYQQPDLNVHFVSNMDGADLAPLLAQLNPRTTLFIVVSKTFGTEETLTNAHTARNWLLANATGKTPIHRHFVAVTSNLEAAAQFGIPPDNLFHFQDWVGGRFSLWSSVGLAIALAIGFQYFEALLAGAHRMDQHFLEAAPRQNLPLTLALLDIWNTNCIGARSHGIFPYSQSLQYLPAYLQQLEMESTGKSVDREGQPLKQDSCPIVWGSSGTTGQHSFFQLLHQGSQPIPSDFILLKDSDFPLAGHHPKLLANGLAQSAALAFGQTTEEARAAGVPEHLLPYQNFPGNQPSTTFLLSRLSPHNLGQLLALYEHKVFCKSVLLNINPFDQWGVELGKRLARTLLPYLEDRSVPDHLDASTRGLLTILAR